MSTITAILKNFCYAPTLSKVLAEVPHRYEFDEVLRSQHLSYEGMSEVFLFICPWSKETSRTLFTKSMSHISSLKLKWGEASLLSELNREIRDTITESTDIPIVHHNEQHPKEGRSQKFHLTLNGKLAARFLQLELKGIKE